MLTTVPSGMLQTTAQYYGFKNRIINGAMVIDQRNAGASGTSNNVYTVDRFAYYSRGVASKFTWGQNLNSVTPPVGFTNYLGFQSSSSYAVSSTDSFLIQQTLEGYNTADLMFGTANAKTITISFWAYSSLTGTFGGALQNYAGTRAYPFSYSMPTANTWTYITITIPGDTGGTWVGASNAGSLALEFGLGQGSTYSGTAGAWVGSDIRNVTGAVSVVGTNGATFYITGVQLEVGTQATSFDYRPYGTELALCQRYFVQIQKYNPFASASYFSSTRADGFMPLPVSMRTTPAFVVTTGTNYYKVYLAGVASGCSTVGFNGTNQQNSIALIYNNSDFSGLANGAGWWDSSSSFSSIGVTAEL